MALVPSSGVALPLAGCRGTTGQRADAPTVLAAEGVFVEDPVVVPEPSGTFATLRVSTELDMACAVVFGRDESLGDGIATDTDMGGGRTPTTRPS